MKNAYLQNGSTFSAVDTDAVHIHEKLPVGTYTINPTMAGIFTYKTSRPDTIVKIERRKSTFAGFNYDSYGLLA